MNNTTKQAIITLAAADPGVTPEILKQLEDICSNKTSNLSLMSSAEVCQLLGGGKPLSKVTLCAWVKAGKLHPVKISRKIYKYHREEVEQFMLRNA